MLRVLVLYPKGEGHQFDGDYWISNHMPLVASKWPKVVKWEADLAGDDMPFFAAAHLYFNSPEDLESTMSSPAAADVMGDVPNYCNFEPTISVHAVAATS